MVEGPDLSFWAQYKERFPDRYGKSGDSFKTAEVGKIFKIIGEAGWRYDVHNLEYEIDVTDVVLQGVFTHVASIFANLWEQKKNT